MISIWNHFNLSRRLFRGASAAGPTRRRRALRRRLGRVLGTASPPPRSAPPFSSRANGRLSSEIVRLSARKLLRRGAIHPNSELAQYARACGRVSVGGDLDKRPVNHPRKRPAAGGKPAHPAQRGTRLEATTDRAFLVSVGPPKAGSPKRLVYLAGRAEGNPPFQTM